MHAASLDDMLKALEACPVTYQPSPFWVDLNKKHIESLKENQLEDLKQGIATKYFTWSFFGIVAHQLWPVIWQWLKHPDLKLFGAQFEDHARSESARSSLFNAANYLASKIYVILLAYFVRGYDRWNLLEKLEEPVLGNPRRVKLWSNWLSQDICNSVFEFYSIWHEEQNTAVNIAELGAGYGRLAYVFLKTLPNITYTIVDIPPALYVSQEYLRQIFPQEDIFYFRNFDRWEEISDEFEKARIRFLMAHQLELLPDNIFDSFVTISTLHEMTFSQVENFIRQISRLTEKTVYIKQWIKSRAKNKNDVTIKQGDYPIPENWKLIFQRRHPIQRWFFEAQYEIEETLDKAKE